MKNSKSKNIIIVGGGPAGIMAAIELSKNNKVTLFEKEKTIGRKFLVAGKGGFNLSNHLSGSDLYTKYTPNKLFANILKHFDSKSLVTWLDELGIPTFVGSSGRIFPEKGIKPIQVLEVLKNKMLEQNVSLFLNHEFIDFDDRTLRFKNNSEIKEKTYDVCILALGGASWSKTGSDGKWQQIMHRNQVATKPFEASNCGLEINYDSKPIAKHIGTPLKNIKVTHQNTSIKGEAVISTYGLEGNAIYPISNKVGVSLKNGTSFISIDLKPFNTEEELFGKITSTTKPKNYSYLFNLNKTQIDLIKSFTDKETYTTPSSFVKTVKNLKLPVDNIRPIEEAISTTGGIHLDALNPNLSLKKFPNIYIAGEMFDWDTITGGFLLQGCFATGYFIAKQINN